MEYLVFDTFEGLSAADIAVLHRTCFTEDRTNDYVPDVTHHVQVLCQDAKGDFFFVEFKHNDMSEMTFHGEVPEDLRDMDCYFYETYYNQDVYCRNVYVSALTGPELLELVSRALKKKCLRCKDLGQYVGYDDFFVGYNETKSFALKEQEDPPLNEGWSGDERKNASYYFRSS